MVRRLLILGGTVLALAACENSSGPFGSRSAGYANSPSAQEGCASGQQADVLHQNRPGGSDYSTLRCHTRGY